MRVVALLGFAAALAAGHGGERFLGALVADVAEWEHGSAGVLGAASEHDSPGKETSANPMWCQIISGLILAGWLAPCFGQQSLGNLAGAVGSIAAILYVFVGGMWTEWQQGAHVGGWCLFVLIIALLDIIRLGCVCCCVGAIVAYAVTNPGVVQMAAATKNMTPEQRAYFQSEEFSKQCEKLFVAAGGTRGGTLHTRRLRQATLSSVSPEDAARLQHDPLFKMAFEQNADEQIDFDAFKQVVMFMIVRAGAAGMARVPERKQYETETHTTITEVE